MKWLVYWFLDKHLWIFPNFNKISPSRRLTGGHNAQKILFLDIDGTIWPDQGPGQILKKTFSEFRKSKDAQVKIDTKVVFVTNQTLFARSEKVRFWDLLTYIFRVAWLCRVFGAAAFLVCHHHANADNPRLRIDCSNRKPSNKMITSFASKKLIALSSSVFVGDRITDAKCSNSAGIGQSILISNEDMFNINESGSSNSLKYAFFSVSYNGFEEVESWFQESV